MDYFKKGNYSGVISRISTLTMSLHSSTVIHKHSFNNLLIALNMLSDSTLNSCILVDVVIFTTNVFMARDVSDYLMTGVFR